MTVAPPRTRRPNPTRTRRHAVITDYPTLLRQVMAELGMPLPRAYQRTS